MTAHFTCTQLPVLEGYNLTTVGTQESCLSTVCSRQGPASLETPLLASRTTHHSAFVHFTISQLHHEYSKQCQMGLREVLSVKLFFSKSSQIMHRVTLHLFLEFTSNLEHSSLGRRTDLFPHITEPKENISNPRVSQK